MLDMSDKVIIISGGTRGQGECEVRLLIKLGANIVYSGRDTEAGSRIEKELGKKLVL